MSAKNSKFSGIFAQARERETADSPEEQAQSEASIAAEVVEEKLRIPSQNTSKTAVDSGKKASKKPSTTPKTSAASRSKAEIPTAKMIPQMSEIAPETASERPTNGRPKGKRSDPNFTQITAYISKKTHQNVKMELLNEGQKREISELIEAQLTAWLAQKAG